MIQAQVDKIHIYLFIFSVALGIIFIISVVLGGLGTAGYVLIKQAESANLQFYPASSVVQGDTMFTALGAIDTESLPIPQYVSGCTNASVSQSPVKVVDNKIVISYNCPLIQDRLCVTNVCSSNHSCIEMNMPDAECSNNFQCTEVFGKDYVCSLNNCSCTFSPAIPVNATQCFQDTDCPLIVDRACSEMTCNLATNRCEETLVSGATCTQSDQCSVGQVCDQMTCTCTDPCSGVPCSSDDCNTRQCILGECVLVSQELGCCLSNADCSAPNDCFTSFCMDNQCKTSLAPGNCGYDADCLPNMVCLNCTCQLVVGPTTCSTQADCDDNVTCTLNFCDYRSECIFLSLPNCCETDMDCETGSNCTIDTCDNVTGMCTYTQLDQDDDGVPCDVDCDDFNATIGAAPFWYRDEDGDGFGTNMVRVVSCTQPSGFVDNNLDCDDHDPTIYFGATVCPYGAMVQAPKSLDFILCGISVSMYETTFVDLCLLDATGHNVTLNVYSMAPQNWVLTDSYVIQDTGFFNESNAVSVLYHSASVQGDIVAVTYLDTMVQRHTKIFSLGSTGSVTLLQTIDTISTNSSLGSIAVHNRTIFLGVPVIDQISVYEESSPNTWTLNTTITRPVTVPSPSGIAGFGSSIAVNNQIIGVGAPALQIDAGSSDSAVYMLNRVTFALEAFAVSLSQRGYGYSVSVASDLVFFTVYVATGPSSFSPPSFASILYPNATLFQNITGMFITSTTTIFAGNETVMYIGSVIDAGIESYTRTDYSAQFFASAIDYWTAGSLAGFSLSGTSTGYVTGAPFSVETGDALTSCIPIQVC